MRSPRKMARHIRRSAARPAGSRLKPRPAAGIQGKPTIFSVGRKTVVRPPGTSSRVWGRPKPGSPARPVPWKARSLRAKNFGKNLQNDFGVLLNHTSRTTKPGGPEAIRSSLIRFHRLVALDPATSCVPIPRRTRRAGRFATLTEADAWRSAASSWLERNDRARPSERPPDLGRPLLQNHRGTSRRAGRPALMRGHMPACCARCHGGRHTKKSPSRWMGQGLSGRSS